MKFEKYKPRVFTKEFKREVVRQVSFNEFTFKEALLKYKLHHSVLYKWMKAHSLGKL